MLQVFLAKIGRKKQTFKIPLPNPHADSAKKHSYEGSSLLHETERVVCKSLKSGHTGLKNKNSTS